MLLGLIRGAAIAVVVVSTLSLAAPLPTPDPTVLAAASNSENIFVRLWAARLKRAKLDLATAITDKTLADQKVARRELLNKTKHVSNTELIEARRNAAVAAANVASEKAGINESESMLAIATAHDSIGRKIPICLELQ